VVPPQNASMNVRLLEGKSSAMAVDFSFETTHILPQLDLNGLLGDGETVVLSLDLPLSGLPNQQQYLSRLVRELNSIQKNLPARVLCTFPDFDLCRLSLVPTTPQRFQLNLAGQLRGVAGPALSGRVELGWNLHWLAQHWKTATLLDLMQAGVQARGVTLPPSTVKNISEITAATTPLFTGKAVPSAVREVEESVKQWVGQLQAVQPGYEGPTLNLRLSEFIPAVFFAMPAGDAKLDDPIHRIPNVAQTIVQMSTDSELVTLLRIFLLMVSRDFHALQAVHLRNRDGKGVSLRFAGVELVHMLELLDAVFPAA